MIRKENECKIEFREHMRDGDGTVKLTNFINAPEELCGKGRLFSKIKKNVLNHEYEWNNDLAEVVKNRPLPLIVAGDFNDTPASHLYHKISHQLNDSYVEEGSGLGITYNDPFPTYRIDYIFHSKELNTLAYRRLVSDFSDHNGIVAVFEIKQ